MLSFILTVIIIGGGIAVHAFLTLPGIILLVISILIIGVVTILILLIIFASPNSDPRLTIFARGSLLSSVIYIRIDQFDPFLFCQDILKWRGVFGGQRDDWQDVVLVESQ
jgi:hypothetical protein